MAHRAGGPRQRSEHTHFQVLAQGLARVDDLAGQVVVRTGRFPVLRRGAEQHRLRLAAGVVGRGDAGISKGGAGCGQGRSAAAVKDSRCLPRRRPRCAPPGLGIRCTGRRTQTTWPGQGPPARPGPGGRPRERQGSAPLGLSRQQSPRCVGNLALHHRGYGSGIREAG